jgi:hypothetical protein
MIYRLRIGDHFTAITENMSNEDQYERNMVFKDEYRELFREWWLPQRAAVAAKNAPIIRRGGEVDAFAFFDVTDKPRLKSWESNNHIKSFRVHLSLDTDSRVADAARDIHAMSPTDASARVASIIRLEGNRHHFVARVEKIKTRQPFPDAELDTDEA